MAKVYYDNDADLSLLNGRKIAVIGYGSQGHAHALNLKDSGCDVMIGLYPGSKSWAQAEQAGLRVATVEQAANEADIIMILAPDQVQKRSTSRAIEPGLSEGKMVMFAHGFNIHFQQIQPPPFVDVDDGRARRARAISSAASSPRAAVCRVSSPFTRTRARSRSRSPWPTPRASAARAPASSTPPSAKRPRPTSSASRSILCGGLSSLIKAGVRDLDRGRLPAGERVLRDDARSSSSSWT